MFWVKPGLMTPLFGATLNQLLPTNQSMQLFPNSLLSASNIIEPVKSSSATTTTLPLPNSETAETLEWPLKASELRHVSNKLGAELLIETIPRFVNGEVKEQAQDHTRATYTRKFTKADGEINLDDDSYKNFLKIQAFENSIGTYFFASSSCSQLLKGAPEFSRRRDINNPNSDKNQNAPLINGNRIRVLIKDAKYENGKLIPRQEKSFKPVQEYLKSQGRFKHLVDNLEEVKKIQDLADYNIVRYKLKMENQVSSLSS